MGDIGNSKPLITDRIYFDGSCPVCAKEIAQLKQRSQTLGYYDIHQIVAESIEFEALCQTLSLQANASLAELQLLLLAELHTFTSDGQILRGLDANIYMWADGGHTLRAAFFRFPLIKPFATKVYDWWSQKRYCKLYQD